MRMGMLLLTPIMFVCTTQTARADELGDLPSGQTTITIDPIFLDQVTADNFRLAAGATDSTERANRGGQFGLDEAKAFDLANMNAAAESSIERVSAMGPPTPPTAEGSDQLAQGQGDTGLLEPVPPPVLVEGGRRHRTINRLETAYHVLAAADVATTLICLGKSWCEEGNPIFGRDPSPLLLIGTKAAYSVGLHYGIEAMEEQDEGAAEVTAWVLTIIQAAVVGLNVRTLM